MSTSQGSWAPEFGAPYKVYQAAWIQTTTSAPVATEAENTIGAIVLARTGTGVCTATCAGAFPSGKTYAVAASPNSIILAVRTSANVITFTNTSDGSTPADDFAATVQIIVKA